MIDAFKAGLRERLAGHKAPFHEVDVPTAAAVIEQIESTDGEQWGTLWGNAARTFAQRGAQLEAAGDAAAGEAYLRAYGLYHAGRFPTFNAPAKEQCYRESIVMYRKAGKYFSPPLEVIEAPFAGKPGEGTLSTFYVRRNGTAANPAPVLIRWGGIDTWKEERHDINERMIAAGFSTINIDMPGVGESPVKGSLDAERQFLPMLDWIRTQPDLDANRVIVLGMSYGGYWATKVAHMYPERFCAAVNWGGGIDKFFTREWNLQSKSASSYVMDLDLARARTVGASSYDEYIETVQHFSLVAQGVLDRPHPPMLVCNGRHDEQVPIDDMLVLVEHGQPKAMRFFPGGHMGYGPKTLPTVIAWLRERAGLASA